MSAPSRAAASAPAKTLLFAAVAVQIAWGALYIERTSFEHEGQRVFTLWDDAMISMQYARNLRRGEGLVWNPGGERVQGFTNLGVTLLMAATHALPLPPRLASLPIQLLCGLALAGTTALLFGAARRLVPEDPRVADAAAIATAACAPLAIWGLQGSDVAFQALWLAASAFVLATRPQQTGLVLVVLGAGLWIRPDAALAYVIWCWAWVGLPGGGARQAWLSGAVLAATAIAQLAFSQLYYGDPLPNTWYLKATGSPRALVLLSGATRLLAHLPSLLPALLLAAVALGAAPRHRLAVACALQVAAALAYNTWVGGDFIVGWGSRFVAPTLPLLLLLAAAGGARLTRRWTGRASRAGYLAAMGVLSAFAGPGLATREWLDPTAPTLHIDSNRNNYRFAAYLRDHTDPTTTVGVHCGGVPVYFGERPAIDVLGKSDRHIAHLEVDRFFPGHSKWDWDYVLHERRPDVIRAPSRGLDAHPAFRRDFLQVETGRGFTFFLRRTSLDKLRDDQVVFVDPLTGSRTRRRGAVPATADGVR